MSVLIPQPSFVTGCPVYRLHTLIDRPPVGGREFMPLSDQVLLGFRLHPGPVRVRSCDLRTGFVSHDVPTVSCDLI